MNIWGILLIILGIIVVVVVVLFQQGGWDRFKAQPLQSSWDATQSITETGKDVFDKGKEIVGNINSNSETSGNLKNLGLPLCNTNSSCNTLQECNENLCFCGENGECFLKN